MRASQAEERAVEKERQRMRAASLRTVRQELKAARQQMAREFVEKKALIVEKLRELRNSKRSIEDIYKYTSEIILEEDDEEEEGESFKPL